MGTSSTSGAGPGTAAPLASAAPEAASTFSPGGQEGALGEGEAANTPQDNGEGEVASLEEVDVSGPSLELPACNSVSVERIIVGREAEGLWDHNFGPYMGS